MHDNDITPDFLKRWTDNNFYYFIWGETAPPDIYKDMKLPTPPKGFYIIGPEEWEPVEIFPNGWEYVAFKCYAEKHNIDFKAITGAVNDKKYNYRYKYAGDKNFLSYPTYFANVVVNHAMDTQRKPLGHTKIKKLFTSMNGRAHPWRCEFIDHMYKYNLFDHGYISWHELDKVDDYVYEFKWWTPTTMSFDAQWNGDDGMCDIYKPPNEFQTSLFSLISESNTECLFYTEKTFLPILNKRPFFIYGAPHANTYIKNYGFEIFDDIIDYSFDSIDDDTLRCEGYFEQVKKLTEIPLDILYKKVYNKCEHNYYRMLDIVENKEYMPKLFEKLAKKHNGHWYLANYNRLLNIGKTESYKEWKHK